MKKRFRKLISNRRGDGIGTIIVAILIILLVGILMFTKVAPLVGKTKDVGDQAGSQIDSSIGELTNKAQRGDGGDQRAPLP